MTNRVMAKCYAPLWISSAVLARSLGAIFMKQTAGAGVQSNMLLALVSPWYVAALCAYVAQAFCWVMVLRRIQLTTAYPFLSLVLALNLVSANLLFHETVTLVHIVGILLIIAGVIVSSRGRVRK